MSRRWIIGFGAALSVAVTVAWATGIASTSSNPESPPFSVTESAVRAECMSGTFVPEEAGYKIEEGGSPDEWRQIEAAPRAMPAERGAVRVTLRRKQGRPATRVTLTGVKFKVFNLGQRPTGDVFYRPCKRRLVGAAVETDFHGYTPKIVGSARNGALGVGFHLPRHSSPIRFPWTVSLTKPLKLYLLVQAWDIYADWTARIAWTSESSHGVIQVDNGGKKYRIVDGQGTSWSKPGPDGQWSDSGSSRWIGVR